MTKKSSTTTVVQIKQQGHLGSTTIYYAELCQSGAGQKKTQKKEIFRKMATTTHSTVSKARNHPCTNRHNHQRTHPQTRGHTHQANHPSTMCYSSTLVQQLRTAADVNEKFEHGGLSSNE